MRIQQFTSIGNRAENQDFMACQMMGDEDGVFVVADGMGGYDNGAIAAKVVVEAIIESVTANWAFTDATAVLKKGIAYANECLALKKLALGCKKMGTCISVLLIKDHMAFLTWFGDCRIYIYRNGIECFHTQDHSVAMELSQIRALKAEDIEKYENIVTRSIMGSETLDSMEIQRTHFRRGDVFLLCTDGLHKSISLPIRMTEDFIIQLEKKGDRYEDNATCLLIET